MKKSDKSNTAFTETSLDKTRVALVMGFHKAIKSDFEVLVEGRCLYNELARGVNENIHNVKRTLYTGFYRKENK